MEGPDLLTHCDWLEPKKSLPEVNRTADMKNKEPTKVTTQSSKILKAIRQRNLILKTAHSQLETPQQPMPWHLRRLRDAIGKPGFLVLQQCTWCSVSVCHLADHLEPINELLWLLHFELTEIAPGRYALRKFDTVTMRKDKDDELDLGIAALIVTSLLENHRCVERFQACNMVMHSTGWQRLLCERLAMTGTMTCLKLSHCNFCKNASISLFEAINLLVMKHLQELCLDALILDGDIPHMLDQLKGGIAQAPCLTMLRITNLNYKGSDQTSRLFADRGLLNALMSNSTITSLDIDCTFLALESGAPLKLLLAQAAALTEFTVRCHKCPSHPKHDVNDLCAVLPGNSAITRLVLDDFDMNPVTVVPLVESLTSCCHLKEANIASRWRPPLPKMSKSEVSKTPHEAWQVHAVEQILRRTPSLQKLAVSCHFSADEVSHLLRIARDCPSLCELSFEGAVFSELCFSDGSERVQSAIERVTFARTSHDTEYMEPVAEAWEQLTAENPKCPLGFPRESAQVLCVALANIQGDRITSLWLNLSGIVIGSVPTALSSYLASTRNLRELSVKMPSGMRFEQHTFIKALTQNSSIEELAVYDSALKKEEAEMLLRWVSSSRRLHSLRISASTGGCSWSLPLETIEHLLESLHTSLVQNYTLTNAYIDIVWKCSWQWHRIAHRVRRNYGLLNCAAAFVLGSELSRATRAFQRVSWHPQLLAVVQRIGSLGKAQAERKIQDSFDRLLQ